MGLVAVETELLRTTRRLERCSLPGARKEAEFSVWLLGIPVNSASARKGKMQAKLSAINPDGFDIGGGHGGATGSRPNSVTERNIR